MTDTDTCHLSCTVDNTFHQAFDLDWLVIMPHRPFLEKVLSRLTYLDKSGAAEGGGNEEGAQSRVEIKTDLHVRWNLDPRASRLSSGPSADYCLAVLLL